MNRLHDEATRRRVFLALAVIFALLCAAGLRRTERELAERYGQGAAVGTVLLASGALEAGRALSASDLRIAEQPVRHRHPLAVPGDELDSIVDMTLSAPLLEGQPLLWSDLATNTGEELLSNAVESGLRAVSIPVKPSDALGGLLRPGDAVDILCTFHRPGVGAVTVTLLQDVLVLATGLAFNPGEQDDNFRNISVQVTPQEAELLFFARRKSELGLALRNPVDRDPVTDLPEVRFSDMAGVEEHPVVRREVRNRILRAPARRSLP